MPKKIQRQMPKVGSTFEKEFRGKNFTLTVVNEEGRTLFRVGKTKYKSPSAAAKAITLNEVNGWQFWGIVKR